MNTPRRLAGELRSFAKRLEAGEEPAAVAADLRLRAGMLDRAAESDEREQGVTVCPLCRGANRACVRCGGAGVEPATA
jgi:hypothetical protein